MEATAPGAKELPLQTATSSATRNLSTVVKPGLAGAEMRMPYEAVAKAIFVKANGLAAYYEATGMVGFEPSDPRLSRSTPLAKP